MTATGRPKQADKADQADMPASSTEVPVTQDLGPASPVGVPTAVAAETAPSPTWTDTSGPDTPAPEAAASSRAPRRRRRGIVLLPLIGVLLLAIPPAGAYLWSLSEPATYAAEVDLLAQPNPNDSSDSMDRELATHQVLLLRPSLVDGVAQQVGRDPQALESNTSVQVVNQSNVLRLQVIDQDRDRARVAADLLASQYAALSSNLGSGSAAPLGHVQVVSPASAPDTPVGPKPLRAAAGGALVGLALLVAFVVVLRTRWQRSRSSVS